jgi:deaminated glutathione amidase
MLQWLDFAHSIFFCKALLLAGARIHVSAQMNNTKHISVSLAQLDVGPDRTDNLNRAKKLVSRAAKRGSDIVCLPELFSYMGSFHDPNSVAETESGPSLSMLRELADRHKIFIVGGSILMKRRQGLPSNTCFMIDHGGKIVSRYSKMHLFDIEIPGKIKFLESKFMCPGRSVSVTNSRFGKLGAAICNDLRYPELFRKMSIAGCRIIFVPAAFTKFTGRDHWIALNRVRAIENQCYIVAVNQSGMNTTGVHFFGSSLIIDPWGKVLKEARPDGDQLITCKIDLGFVDKIRKQLPALAKIRKSYPLHQYK